MKELRASARGYARVDLPDPGGLLCRTLYRELFGS